MSRFPTRHPADAASARLVSTALTAFALTLVVALVVLTTGLVPNLTLPYIEGPDAAVILLFVPACALFFAVLVETVRATAAHDPLPRRENRLHAWKPGTGEG